MVSQFIPQANAPQAFATPMQSFASPTQSFAPPPQVFASAPSFSMSPPVVSSSPTFGSAPQSFSSVGFSQPSTSLSGPGSWNFSAPVTLAANAPVVIQQPIYYPADQFGNFSQASSASFSPFAPSGGTIDAGQLQQIFQTMAGMVGQMAAGSPSAGFPRGLSQPGFGAALSADSSPISLPPSPETAGTAGGNNILGTLVMLAVMDALKKTSSSTSKTSTSNAGTTSTANAGSTSTSTSTSNAGSTSANADQPAATTTSATNASSSGGYG